MIYTESLANCICFSKRLDWVFSNSSVEPLSKGKLIIRANVWSRSSADCVFVKILNFLHSFIDIFLHLKFRPYDWFHLFFSDLCIVYYILNFLWISCHVKSSPKSIWLIWNKVQKVVFTEKVYLPIFSIL